MPNFTNDKDLIDLLLGECEDLTKNSKNGVNTHWLCSKPEPYIYPDKNPVHSPKDINDFPTICKLMNLVNSSDKIDGPLDSCLVLKYSDSAAALREHADDEKLIDQNKSICSFSLGATRTIDFYNKSGRSKLITTHNMEQDSLVIMKPSCQQKLLHCVRADKTRSTKSQVRFSISFRAICLDESANTPDEVHVDTLVSPPSKKNPASKVTLIAGDSYAARLDESRLGKNRKNVVNIAKGGQKIRHVEESLVRYVNDNPDVFVEKLIVSVGTNDIRYCYNGVGHLKGPIKQLFKKIKELCPRTKVYIQSLLPLPVINRNIIHNVVCFNNLLINCCAFEHFYYLDVIPNFLDERGMFRSKALFNSSVKDIHPNNRGMGVLAKYYIFVIHNKRFNPLAI